MAVFLRSGTTNIMHNLEAELEETRQDLAIVALRLLVGCSTVTTPQEISVMGRAVKPEPGKKKWYAFYLTAQEVAQSLRNGLVSVEIGRAVDLSCYAELDGLEVYALERGSIQKWLPSTLQSVVATKTEIRCFETEQKSGESFRACLTSLARLKSLWGSFKPSATEKSFVRDLIRFTVLENDKQIESAIGDLSASVEQDEDARQAFHDKAVLSGCSEFLKNCQHTLGPTSLEEHKSDFHRMWSSLTPQLRSCFRKAAQIARLRPMNYFQAAEDQSLAIGSIAADASMFINKCFNRAVHTGTLVSDFVELCLLEAAVTNGTPRGRFGSFEGLRTLLESPNQSVVGLACASISRFSRRRSIFQQMQVKYMCDGCNLFPIKDVRFTRPDDEHSFDLCRDCYRLGKEFASNKNRKLESNVVVNGSPIGESPKLLTCGEILMMQPIAIQTPGDSSHLPVSEAEDGAEVAHRQQLFDDFMDGLLSGIAELLGSKLERLEGTNDSLIWLSVDLVRHSLRSKRKVGRAKDLMKSLTL
jgi:hypothetical protein